MGKLGFLGSPRKMDFRCQGLVPFTMFIGQLCSRNRGCRQITLVVAVGGGSDRRPSPASQELSLRSLRAEPLFSLCRCPAVHLHSDKHLSQVPWAQGDCAGPQAVLNGTVVMMILVLLL